MSECKKCGVDHDNPGNAERAAKVLACAMPEYDFYTREGKVDPRKRRVEA